MSPGLPTMTTWGLSPRVRGNQLAPPGACHTLGSIPACAGEPAVNVAGVYVAGVYPRVCGGTHGLLSEALDVAGLSPRVRGNRLCRRLHRDYTRSIPACAGEPAAASSLRRLVGVYPRVCGGTEEILSTAQSRKGLSPRVRGNPAKARAGASRSGSIPACAGEPVSASSVPKLRTVYPRVCGGTLTGVWSVSERPGLSPRVRGNRGAVFEDQVGRRSIPACAGEP